MAVRAGLGVACGVVMYCIVVLLYCAVLYCTVLYCTVLYCVFVGQPDCLPASLPACLPACHRPQEMSCEMDDEMCSVADFAPALQVRLLAGWLAGCPADAPREWLRLACPLYPLACLPACLPCPSARLLASLLACLLLRSLHVLEALLEYQDADRPGGAGAGGEGRRQ